MNYNDKAVVNVNYMITRYGSILNGDWPYRNDEGVKKLLEEMLLDPQVYIEKRLIFNIVNSITHPDELLFKSALFLTLNVYAELYKTDYLVSMADIKNLIESADVHIRVSVDAEYISTKIFLKNLTSDINDLYENILKEV